MDNVAVFVEDEPPADDPELLGLYEGTPLTDRGEWYAGVLPDRITDLPGADAADVRDPRGRGRGDRDHRGARDRPSLRDRRRAAARAGVRVSRARSRPDGPSCRRRSIRMSICMCPRSARRPRAAHSGRCSPRSRRAAWPGRWRGTRRPCCGPPPTGAFPWAIFWVNVLGCALIGVLMVLVGEGGRRAHPLVRPFLGVGVLGGFTTFSTYALDFSELLDARGGGHRAGVRGGTLAGAMGAVWLAASVTRRGVTRRVARGELAAGGGGRGGRRAAALSDGPCGAGAARLGVPVGDLRGQRGREPGAGGATGAGGGAASAGCTRCWGRACAVR